MKDQKAKSEKKHKFENLQCPTEAALAVIGGKYKIIILYHLDEMILRYNELAKKIPNATPKMLSTQLKELENDGLISRTLYPVVPPKTEYALTPLGKSLSPIIKLLSDWGEEYFAYLGLEHKKCDKKED